MNEKIAEQGQAVADSKMKILDYFTDKDPFPENCFWPSISKIAFAAIRNEFHKPKPLLSP